METFVGWCGFTGAWLLVIGPLYQGALELLEQDLDRDGLDEAEVRIAPPPPPSNWWWFFPPVMFVLRRRRTGIYHREVLAFLTPLQRAQRTGFIRKAAGWFTVASGASLLAVRETWEVADQGQWPIIGFLSLIVFMFALAGGNTALLIRRQRNLLGGAPPAAGC